MKVNLPFFSFRSVFFLSTIVLFLAACDKSKPPCEGNFDEGAFVVCEGQFGAGNGSVDWFDDEEQATCSDLFGSQNGGASLGDVVQSATLHDGKLWVVINNSNNIVVVNAKTFEFEAEITGFELPRYLKIIGKKGYVSQWGTDGLTGSIAVVDLETKKILKKITGLPNGPEQMEVFGDRLIVGSSGGFEQDSSIAVINFATDALEKTVRVGQNPASLAVSGGQLFVLCQGFYDFATFTYFQSYLLKMNAALDQAEVFEAGNGSTDLVSTSNGDLFWSDPTGGKILTLKKGATEAAEFWKKTNGSFYGLAVSPSDEIWALDAGDFQSAGAVRVFKSPDVVVRELPTGVVPTAVVFKN